MAAPHTVEIWSDIACPWCYIGKRRFEAGVELFGQQHPGAEVDVVYRSFELAPDTPVDFDGSEADFLVRHKGLPLAKVQEMLATVTHIARSVGLAYDFDAVRHTNTAKAHELLHHARAHGRQVELKERLLRAYFVEGGHVGRVDELVALAAEVGLDPEAARRSLADAEHADDVAADQQRALDLGIRGVPFFVIDGRYGISGAQQPEAFAEALGRAAADRGATAEAS